MEVVSKPKKSPTKKKAEQKDFSKGYNAWKEFDGKQYTGMKIGGHHKWYYDKGEWKEEKVTPDKWKFSYAVTKRRAGHAPEGSGVPVGTEYHWYILAHQTATKLDANDYTTSMTGFKYKLSHKRADKDKWNISDKTQKKHLIKILQEMIDELESQMEEPWIDMDGTEETKETKPVKANRRKKELVS